MGNMEKIKVLLTLMFAVAFLPGCQHKAKPLFMSDIDECLEDCSLPKVNDKTVYEIEETVEYDDEEYYWDNQHGDYKHVELRA